MTALEMLVKLLKRTEYQYTVLHSLTAENVADDLIKHGVKVEQTTPDSFLEKVKETIRKYDDDVEVMHSVLDELMEDLLIEFGYAESVEHIRDSERWYA